MNEKTITNSKNETIALGKQLGMNLNAGCTIALEGDLGTGKTHFTKGIALGLGIEDTISSPTFTLLKEYEGRLKLKHIDAYRLENADPDSLGLYDLLDDESVVVIEWSNFLDDASFDFDIRVRIVYLDEDKREVEIVYDENFNH